MTAFADDVPFGVIGVGVIVVVPLILFMLLGMLFDERPLRPDDRFVSSSTFGVSTDDRWELIGSRHALVAGASAIERGKPSSSAPKSVGPHGLKKPDGADGEWQTTPLP